MNESTQTPKKQKITDSPSDQVDALQDCMLDRGSEHPTACYYITTISRD